MKIEAGKKYVTREGVIVGPMRLNDGDFDSRYRFQGEGVGINSAWTDDGSYLIGYPNDSRDLVAGHCEPVMAPCEPVEPHAFADEYDTAARDAINEVRRARELWPNKASSAHEQYAILLEEMDELKAHVWTNQKRRNLAEMRKEAVQVAAMAIRFAAECCGEESGRK